MSAVKKNTSTLKPLGKLPSTKTLSAPETNPVIDIKIIGFMVTASNLLKASSESNRVFARQVLSCDFVPDVLATITELSL